MEQKRPVHTISYEMIRAYIWRNDTATMLFHDVTFFRSQRQGSSLANSCCFGAKDLPLLAKVILDAHAWIHGQVTGQQQDAASPAQAQVTSNQAGPTQAQAKGQ